MLFRVQWNVSWANNPQQHADCPDLVRDRVCGRCVATALPRALLYDLEAEDEEDDDQEDDDQEDELEDGGDVAMPEDA